MRLGAPIFAKTPDPDELAQAHVEKGYRASYCRLGVNTPPEQVEACRQAFAKHDVAIAEANAMCISILNTDEAKRQEVIQQIKGRLAFADKIGARCCVIHGGTVQPEGWGQFTPENLSQDSFDRMVNVIQEIIDDVQPSEARLGVEIEPYTLPDSPQVYRDLIDAIDRPGFGVHFDPVNTIISPRTLAESGRWMQEYFDAVGPWIVSCHAKDLILDRGDGFRYGYKEVPPGEGFFDYEVFLKGVSELPLDPPMMIEHLKTEEEYDAARDFILGVAERIGVDIMQ